MPKHWRPGVTTAPSGLTWRQHRAREQAAMGSSRRRYRNGTRSGDPRIIQARYASVCAETGREIKAGDSCVYYPPSTGQDKGKVYHLESEQATRYRMWADDVSRGYEY